MLENLRRRIEEIEQRLGSGHVTLMLENGGRFTLPAREILNCMSEAIAKPEPVTLRGQMLLRAVSSSDGNRIFELAQAIVQRGPCLVKPQETQPERKLT